ncbi:MAG: inhibitor of cysteine peptidase [Methanolobus sp.]|jgi:inhibitor of cysteine peptidase|uniref:protease inhibitor I42 family protein n=1 Tax=Methanolobus sp. TaxID=1874737 RepID=UPI0024AC0B1D|nr:protease inhibitor I42 family protein [Methanolobus sp.]MDI3486583.1 inhibitor of cysteine peptidase [Methanolobus sp.]MDK2830574.1 inhibitor of cysteine peptidase [Methanolobus sp.]MDK2938113.1 inhibitor of cysteine peptidase [Methanolobus sp.]
MNIRLFTVAAVVLLVCMTCGCVSESDDTGEYESNASIDDINTTTPDVEEQPGITDNSGVSIGTMSNVTQHFSENESQSTAYAIIGDTIIVTLQENPTTGYSWNMTYSEGLKLKEDVYAEASIRAEMVGAPGYHTWIFEVTDMDEQNISAIYIRPWEEPTGTEDSYELTIDVIPESELITDTGIVTYNNLEGGFYGIIGAYDTNYDPINLPDDFKTDGTEIRFTAYQRDDMMSFHMWGQIIELRTISPIL